MFNGIHFLQCIITIQSIGALYHHFKGYGAIKLMIEVKEIYFQRIISGNVLYEEGIDLNLKDAIYCQEGNSKADACDLSGM